MRIHLQINAAGKTISFDHQKLLTGTIHKWLGQNEEHGKMALHSFSRLEGAKAFQNKLYFEKDAYFFFSSQSDELIKQLIRGIQKSPKMFNSLEVNEIIIQEDPDLTTQTYYSTASPIFIKRHSELRTEHILYNDVRSDAFLKETLERKMTLAGMALDDSLKIYFDRSYPKAGTKKINYDGIENRASWCPVIIEGAPETKLFAWNVGLGNSTGIGFGAIK